MPDANHSTGAIDGTDYSVDDELFPSIDLRSLTAHLASLDLDPPTIELLMAVLTADVDEVPAANA